MGGAARVSIAARGGERMVEERQIHLPDETKVKAMQARIIEECEKQDFTVSDFRSLLTELGFALKNRLSVTDGELFRV